MALALSAMALLLGTSTKAQAAPHVAKACPGVVKGVYYYRNAARGWERKLGQAPTKSSFNASIIRSCPYTVWVAHKWAARAKAMREKYKAWWHEVATNPEVAICLVFGPYCSQAKAVAWCEGKYGVYAHNGQYLGTFQMGTRERSIYGHGKTVLAQAQAAWRYFVASGKDWSPWQCKP